MNEYEEEEKEEKEEEKKEVVVVVMVKEDELTLGRGRFKDFFLLLVRDEGVKRKDGEAGELVGG